MGVMNLWNTCSFRTGMDLEEKLDLDGVFFHQMHPHRRFESSLFPRPLKRLSPWPDIHSGWDRYDVENLADGLSRQVQER